VEPARSKSGAWRTAALELEPLGHRTPFILGTNYPFTIKTLLSNEFRGLHKDTYSRRCQVGTSLQSNSKAKQKITRVTEIRPRT